MAYMNMYEKAVKESAGKRISRTKAIRLKCLDCCAYQSSEVAQCISYDCPLWRYRMGHEERDELYYQHKKENSMSEEAKQRFRQKQLSENE